MNNKTLCLILATIFVQLFQLDQFSSVALASTTFNVKQDGTGHFTTIQACADVAKAGDTCLVYPGLYPEYVETKYGGSSESTRITFRANGLVKMEGFEIAHPYITVDGFEMAQGTNDKLAYISVVVRTAFQTGVTTRGDYCLVLNNTIKDGVPGTIDPYGRRNAGPNGVKIPSIQGKAVNNCKIIGNKLSNLNGNMLEISGNDHLFEGNTFRRVNNLNYIYLFGNRSTFKHNYFTEGNTTNDYGISLHTDWLQIFGDNASESMNHLFEENFIENLGDSAQLGNLTSGGYDKPPFRMPNIRGVTFRRNVFANNGANFNVKMPDVVFDHNTLYRAAYKASGITASGDLTSGDSAGLQLVSNAFVGGGAQTTAGYYALKGRTPLAEESLIKLLTANAPFYEVRGKAPVASATIQELKSKGYLDPNEVPTDLGVTIRSRSQFDLDPVYLNGKMDPNAYEDLVYDVYKKNLELGDLLKSTQVAHHNFVAGPAPTFAPKKSSDCLSTIKGNGIFTSFNFCEAILGLGGINGGDPKFQNINPTLSCPGSPRDGVRNDLLGCDGIPFTLDDGLKPLPGSPLCAKGMARTDIGAYSCDPAVVFSGGITGIMYGDVSGNNKVSTYDAALVAIYSLNPAGFDWTADQIKRADVSGSNGVTSYDAALIARYAAHIIFEFPVEQGP